MRSCRPRAWHVVSAQYRMIDDNDGEDITALHRPGHERVHDITAFDLSFKVKFIRFYPLVIWQEQKVLEVWMRVKKRKPAGLLAT